MTTAQNDSTGLRQYDSSKKIAWQSLDSGDIVNTAEMERQYREFIKEALWHKENSESFHSFVEEVQWYRAH
jgi:proline dehydrogenase